MHSAVDHPLQQGLHNSRLSFFQTFLRARLPQTARSASGTLCEITHRLPQPSHIDYTLSRCSSQCLL